MVILACVGLAYLFLCADNHIRHYVEQRLADHYASHHVQIRSARRVSAHQIVLRGLEIRDRDAPRQADPLLSIDEVLIRCNTGVDDLVQLRFSLDHITLRGVSLNVEHRADGSFNLPELCPLPKLGNDSLLVVVEDGRLTYVDRRRFTSRPIELSDVAVQVEFPAEAMSKQQTSSMIKFHGSARGTQSQRLQFVGQFDKPTKAWTATGRLNGLLVASELERSVPHTWSEPLRQLGSFRTQANLQFQLSSRGPSAFKSAEEPQPDVASWFASPFRFAVDGELSDGHLEVDSRLPFPLTEMSSEIHCDNDRLTVIGLEARCGRTTLNASLKCDGYGLQHPFMLTATARSVHLVEYTSVLESLPQAVREHWGQFSPAGEVSFQLDVAGDGKEWRPDVSITCHNLSFTSPKINYRLHRGQGTISLRNNILDVDLAAQASGQAVHIGGRIHDPGPAGWGRIELRSIDPIPINRTLLESLEPKARDILAAFHPMGSFMVRHAQFERTEPTQPWHHDLLLSLERCFMQHKLFPYPLSNVRGMLRMRDGEWTFYDLEGQNDSGHVVGHGRWERTREGGLLSLDFAGSQIALEDELRNALSTKARGLWTHLRPRGTMDRVLVSISHRKQQPVSLHVVLEKLVPEKTIEGGSISINPTWFPYPLDDITGQLVYDNTGMTFSRLRARHGSVQIVTGGGCQWDGHGSWQFRLDDLSVDRLILDRELAAALPDRLRRAAIQLDPNGPITLMGAVTFRGGPELPLAAGWNVTLNTAGSSIHSGVHLKNVFGGVRLVGSYDGQHFESQGELDIDSLRYRDVQLTAVKGPIWIDDSRVFLGSWSSRAGQQQTQPHLEARVFGGTLYADGQIPFNSQERFEINASLADGELGQASIVAGARQAISGKAFGIVKLTGAGTGLHTLSGSGTINLHEADIYELPFMVALLKIVKIRPPDRTAFTESDARFRISGEHIYFDPIKFKGDAISLVGKGDLDFAGDLNLDFYSMVGREQLKLPLIRPVLGEASRQFMLIHVGGSLDDPQMKRQPFPALNETIQQIFPEAVRRPEQRTTRLPRAWSRDRITR